MSMIGTLRRVSDADLDRLLARPEGIREFCYRTEGVYGAADRWALDEEEARAEKVRAAFTCEEIRDFYDLEQLARAGKEFQSERFRALVGLKLAESRVPVLADQSASFGLAPRRRRRLGQQRKGRRPVVRATEEAFDLDGMLARFDALWSQRH